MKSKLLALFLLGGSAAFAQNFSFGIGINVGPPRPPVVRYVPPSPGRGYVWVPGYYRLNNNRYFWNNGYWTRPPHARAKWIAPRYNKGRYYQGYWR